jgi:hypothetical protein
VRLISFAFWGALGVRTVIECVSGSTGARLMDHAIFSDLGRVMCVVCFHLLRSFTEIC